MVCAREGCEETFEPRTHNQIYHNKKCCSRATNARIMERYYERQNQKNGAPRLCSECQVTKLSRYNDSRVCASCETKKREKLDGSISNVLLAIA